MNKFLLVGLASLGFMAVVSAQAEAQSTTRIYNERGQHTLTARPSPGRTADSDRMILRDERGRNAGSIRNDRIYNERGQSVGTIRRDWRR